MKTQETRYRNATGSSVPILDKPESKDKMPGNACALDMLASHQFKMFLMRSSLQMACRHGAVKAETFMW
jgi:hypothetical protein